MAVGSASVPESADSELVLEEQPVLITAASAPVPATTATRTTDTCVSFAIRLCSLNKKKSSEVGDSLTSWAESTHFRRREEPRAYYARLLRDLRYGELAPRTIRSGRSP
jgi:hypothetical protein